MQNWVVVLHPYLGKPSNLTHIFQQGWNHQLENLYHIGASSSLWSGYYAKIFGPSRQFAVWMSYDVMSLQNSWAATGLHGTENNMMSMMPNVRPMMSLQVDTSGQFFHIYFRWGNLFSYEFSLIGHQCNDGTSTHVFRVQSNWCYPPKVCRWQRVPNLEMIGYFGVLHALHRLELSLDEPWEGMATGMPCWMNDWRTGEVTWWNWRT